MGTSDHCLKTDSPIFCEFITVFRLKLDWNLANCPSIFENSSPFNFFMRKKTLRRDFFDKVDMWGDQTSYVILFIYDIMSDRMSHLRALYDNFGIFWKKYSMGKNFRKSRGSSRNFNRFSIWKRFLTHKR